MARDRFYIGQDPYEGTIHILGWDLDHEPTPDNECGYVILAGPFDTREQAEEALENM